MENYIIQILIHIQLAHRQVSTPLVKCHRCQCVDLFYVNRKVKSVCAQQMFRGSLIWKAFPSVAVLLLLLDLSAQLEWELGYLWCGKWLHTEGVRKK